MSSYRKLTRNPETGLWENAEWLDDYFGLHRYGVRFPSDGSVANPEVTILETKDDTE